MEERDNTVILVVCGNIFVGEEPVELCDLHFTQGIRIRVAKNPSCTAGVTGPYRSALVVQGLQLSSNKLVPDRTPSGVKRQVVCIFGALLYTVVSVD
jgi:hypothetical protein